MALNAAMRVLDLWSIADTCYMIAAGPVNDHNLRNVQNLSIVLCGNLHLLNCVGHSGDTKNQGLCRSRRLPSRCTDLPERLSRLAVLAPL